MKKTKGLKLETHTTEICEALLFIVKSHCATDIRDIYLSLTEYCEDASLLVWMGAYTQNNDLLPKSPGSSSWSSSTENHRPARLEEKSGGHQDQPHAQTKDNWLEHGTNSTKF